MNDQQRLAAATQQHIHAMPMVPLKPSDIQKMQMQPVQPAAFFPNGLPTPAPFLKTNSGRDIPFVAPAEDFVQPVPTTIIPPFLSRQSSHTELLETSPGKTKRHSQMRPSNASEIPSIPQKYEVASGPVEVSSIYPGSTV